MLFAGSSLTDVAVIRPLVALQAQILADLMTISSTLSYVSPCHSCVCAPDHALKAHALDPLRAI